MAGAPGAMGQAVAETIARHPEVVGRWLADEPGAWGFLAGQGVLAYRRQLGRRLADAERRQVWAALWTELERLRGDRAGDEKTPRG